MAFREASASCSGIGRMPACEVVGRASADSGTRGEAVDSSVVIMARSCVLAFATETTVVNKLSKAGIDVPR